MIVSPGRDEKTKTPRKSRKSLKGPSFNKRIVTFVAGDILAKSRARRSAAKAKGPDSASKDNTTVLPEANKHFQTAVKVLPVAFWPFFSRYVSFTLPETNITPDNGWLED